MHVNQSELNVVQYLMLMFWRDIYLCLKNEEEVSSFGHIGVLWYCGNVETADENHSSVTINLHHGQCQE